MQLTNANMSGLIKGVSTAADAFEAPDLVDTLAINAWVVFLAFVDICTQFSGC